MKRELTLSAFSLYLCLEVEANPQVNMADELPSPVISSSDTSEDVCTIPEGDDTSSINVWGLVSIIVFYLVVLFIGIWAGWKQRKGQSQTDQETVMLAGRNIGLFVGVLTMGGKNY